MSIRQIQLLLLQALLVILAIAVPLVGLELDSFRLKGNVRNLRKPYYAPRACHVDLRRWTPRRSKQTSASNIWGDLYVWNVFQSAVLAHLIRRSNTRAMSDEAELPHDQLLDTGIRVFSTRQKPERREASDVTEVLPVTRSLLGEGAHGWGRP
jgi:hypothetical protein